MKKTGIFLIFIFCIGQIGFTQTKASPFDFGKMWTFENPPKEWFKEAYGFEPNDQWFKDVRMSSLKFASWCSASFVSPNGLIMTNHHCSRDVVGKLQKDGENFDKNGFYATTLKDERKAEGLFVEQLIHAIDITEQVNDKLENANDQLSPEETVANTLKEIEAMYSKKDGWQDLRTQVVTYYSGGKYSLYAFKRFSDIRLVLIPELDLGFYGGDPDNFTYPRYNLDCTFWRAYDDNGNPLNTSAHYLKFNTDGVHEGEPTFVVGNPGSTERYRTVDQLKWDRDYRYKMQLKFMSNRLDIMNEEYDMIKDDPEKEFEAQEKLNTIANIGNGVKAITGRLEGMHNPNLFNRKIEMEQHIRTNSPNVDYWDQLSAEYDKLLPKSWAIMHLGQSGLRGNTLLLLYEIAQYENQLAENAEQSELDATMEKIHNLGASIDDKKERRLFKLLLTEIQEDIYPGDPTLKNLLEGANINDYVNRAVMKTVFTNKDKTEAYLANLNESKTEDPLLKASRILISKYRESLMAFQASSAKRKSLEQKIANQVFNVYGSTLPPDATFTLRISDGVVKGYEYNGTTAPTITTYFGMYDRHYSHGKVFPWSLPKKWQNPPMELLMAPLNYVSTNDIIGGNSGSPMINKKKECIGLIFDGNIESLPGNFIFDEEKNRTVSVHAGGIVAAMKYVYKADRIVNELQGM